MNAMVAAIIIAVTAKYYDTLVVFLGILDEEFTQSLPRTVIWLSVDTVLVKPLALTALLPILMAG